MCYVAYARIKYWNAVTETVDTENIALTQIQSFTEAMKRIENIYEDDLVHCELFLCENNSVFLKDEDYEAEKLAGIGNA